MIPNCRAWGIRPDLLYPRNDHGSKLLTDTLKGPHKEVMWAASGPRTVGWEPLVYDVDCLHRRNNNTMSEINPHLCSLPIVKQIFLSDDFRSESLIFVFHVICKLSEVAALFVWGAYCNKTAAGGQDVLKLLHGRSYIIQKGFFISIVVIRGYMLLDPLPWEPVDNEASRVRYLFASDSWFIARVFALRSCFLSICLPFFPICIGFLLFHSNSFSSSSLFLFHRPPFSCSYSASSQ
jgi:hypothetical protein